jgi:hypothetical protein
MIEQDLKPNTLAYEQRAFVKATGFREYDARWLFEKEVNLEGIQAIGMAIVLEGFRPTSSLVTTIDLILLQSSWRSPAA